MGGSNQFLLVGATKKMQGGDSYNIVTDTIFLSKEDAIRESANWMNGKKDVLLVVEVVAKIHAELVVRSEDTK